MIEMIMLLLALLAAFVVAAGLDAARESGIDDTVVWGWDGVSRSALKRAIRRAGFRLAAGQLALIMGDENWRPGQGPAARTFVAVPREGRSWTGARRRAIREEKKSSRRTATNSAAALSEKLTRDRARLAARQAAKATRVSTRALPKGVWAARLANERAAARAAAMQFAVTRRAPQANWGKVVSIARRPEQLLAVARATSVSRYHAAADRLEEALAATRAAISDFAKAQARATVAWAKADLRKELLAA